MSLRKKTLIIIGAILGMLIQVLYAASYFILRDSFAELEAQDVRQNVQRVISTLEGELAVLDTVAVDLASWDDTYDFVQAVDRAYIESNLGDDAFIALRLNLVVFVDGSGQVVYAKGYDLESRETVDLPPGLDEHLAKGGLYRQPEVESGLAGLVLFPDGPMLLSSRPILTSEGEGPPRGTLNMGRYLDPSAIDRLGRTTDLALSARRIDDPQMPPDFDSALPAMSETEPVFVRPLGASRVAGYTLIEDIYGEPALVLRAEMPRDIYRQGLASTRYYLASLLGLGLLFVVVTWVSLARLVLSRLVRLSSDVSRIGQSNDLSARVAMSGDDELSDLASAINDMLQALERSQGELQENEEQLKQRLLEQETLFAISRLISSSLQAGQVMGLVAEHIARLVDASCCVLSDWDPVSERLTVRGRYVHPEHTALDRLVDDVGRSYPVSSRLAAAEAIRFRRASIVYRSELEPGSQGFQMLEERRWSAVVVLPIVLLDRVIGLAEVYQAEGALPFTDHDLRLLGSLLDQVAVAINNARLFSVVQANEVALRELSLRLIDAQEQERRHIAQELHDELGQLLTAIKINVDLARRKLPDREGVLEQRMAEASALVDRVLTHVRAMTVDLRPTLLDDMGIVPTLRWYVKQFAQRTDIEVHFESSDLPGRLRPEIETTIYRVVQEALTNVARHAHAAQVQVDLACSEDTVTISIADDGDGFDAGAWAKRRGEPLTLGLTGIRERVMLLGGEAAIRSAPGQGTQIEAALPARYRPLREEGEC